MSNIQASVPIPCIQVLRWSLFQGQGAKQKHRWKKMAVQESQRTFSMQQKGNHDRKRSEKNSAMLNTPYTTQQVSHWVSSSLFGLSIALILKGNTKASVSCSKISMRHFQTLYFHSCPPTPTEKLRQMYASCHQMQKYNMKTGSNVEMSGQAIITSCYQFSGYQRNQHQLSPGSLLCFSLHQGSRKHHQ